MSADFERILNIQPAVPFALKTGGRYQVSVVGTWNSGSMTLQQLSPDGSTYLNVDDPYTANGGWVYDLPPGTYQMVNVSVTGWSMSVVRIPGG